MSRNVDSTATLSLCSTGKSNCVGISYFLVHLEDFLFLCQDMSDSSLCITSITIVVDSSAGSSDHDCSNLLLGPLGLT